MPSTPGAMRALAAVAIIFWSRAAHATHFRYGNITYTIPDPANAPRTVQFEVTSAWRDGYPIGMESSLHFGNGVLGASPPGPAIGTGFDSKGIAYTLRKYVMTYTYPPDGQDQFIASFTSCCRSANLLNAPLATFLVTAKVDLAPRRRRSSEGSRMR